MKDWSVILGIDDFKIINNRNITAMNIGQVVRMSLTLEKAVRLSTQLNKTLDRIGY